MPKNKFLIFIILLIAENAAMASSAHDTVIKFSIAMLGVVFSTFAIYIGLSIYNKIRNKMDINISPEEEVLRTPKTTDDAIKFFIRKNKIQ